MITFKEIEELKDDDVVTMSGKSMKELMDITRCVRSARGRANYVLGGRLTTVVAAGTKVDIPAIFKLAAGIAHQILENSTEGFKIVKETQ